MLAFIKLLETGVNMLKSMIMSMCLIVVFNEVGICFFTSIWLFADVNSFDHLLNIIDFISLGIINIALEPYILYSSRPV
jgi:hypothetical protein